MASSIETLRQSIASLNVTSPTGAEVAREIRGDYRGERVVTATIASQLQDAAEEIGMAVAHRSDRRTLDRREVRQGQAASIEALARIADYYDKLPDMPREDALRSLVERLQTLHDILQRSGRGGGQTVSREDVLAALQSFDPDVTHQFAGLDIAREFFAAAGASDEFQLLLDQAHAEYGKGDLAKEVKAGFAASHPAARAAATLETDPAAVREAYRALLRETKNMGQLFEAFRRFDVMKNFGEIIEVFMSAAGRDLASAGPSTDATYLHALITELSKLKKMQSVVDMAGNLTRTTDRLLQRGEAPKGDAADVAGRILSFASSAAPGAADARSMLDRYRDCTLATQVVFANGLRALHGELPDEVAPSPQARLQQSAAILAMLDILVAEEDREYENEEEGYEGSAPGQDEIVVH